MAEGTREIREEIEETRRRVGDEVEALSYKTDVGARIGGFVEEKKEAVASGVAEAKDTIVSTVGGAMPSREAAGTRLRSVRATARRNPLGMAIGAAAAGFIAGLAAPSTRIEEERLGEASARLKETATEAGHEALERGKDVARAAVETARETGAEQGRELAADLADRVQGREPSTT